MGQVFRYLMHSFATPRQQGRPLKQTGKKVLYNTSKIQNINSSRCGYYCYFYIIMRDKGMNPYDILYQFHPSGEKNDNILIDILEDNLQ